MHGIFLFIFIYIFLKNICIFFHSNVSMYAQIQRLRGEIQELTDILASFVASSSSTFSFDGWALIGLWRQARGEFACQGYDDCEADGRGRPYARAMHPTGAGLG
jgi:hypothetical protein